MKKIFSIIVLMFVTVCLFSQDRVLVPELIVPENGDEDHMPNVLLDWDAVAASEGLVVTYEIQISLDDAFTDPQVIYTDLSALRADQLLFGTEYFWKVKATDGVTTSGWSETWSFTTFDEIVLSKPNDGKEDQEPDVDLKWKTRISGNDIGGMNEFKWILLKHSTALHLVL